MTVKGDGRVVFPGKAGKGGSHTVTLKPAGRAGSRPCGWNLLPDPAHKGRLAREGALSSVTVTPAFAVRHADGKETPVKLWFGDADRQEPLKWAGTAPVPGLLAGWKTQPARGDQPHTAVWLLDKPMTLAEGDTLVVTLKSDNVGAARVSVSPFGWDDLRAATLGERDDGGVPRPAPGEARPAVNGTADIIMEHRGGLVGPRQRPVVPPLPAKRGHWRSGHPVPGAGQGVRRLQWRQGVVPSDGGPEAVHHPGAAPR